MKEIYRFFMWLISHLWGQSWFWTKEWQEGERQVDEDVKAGRYQSFKSIDEMIASLDEEERELGKEMRALEELSINEWIEFERKMEDE